MFVLTGRFFKFRIYKNIWNLKYKKVFEFFEKMKICINEHTKTNSKNYRKFSRNIEKCEKLAPYSEA